MPRFSANLGFLWSRLDLPQAVRAAARAGFDAVECHWPYDTPPEALRDALNETGLPLLGLNTAQGNVSAGDFGLTALPGRAADARAAIDAAVDYARAADAEAIHVMAGRAEGAKAGSVFRDNLAYACDIASDRTILIEPINPFDAPGYFLQSTDHAQQVIADVNAPNLKLMFDCYHVARVEGDVIARLRAVCLISGIFSSLPCLTGVGRITAISTMTWCSTKSTRLAGTAHWAQSTGPKVTPRHRLAGLPVHANVLCDEAADHDRCTGARYV